MTQYSYFPASVDMPLFLPTADWNEDRALPQYEFSTIAFQQFQKMYSSIFDTSSLKSANIQVLPKQKRTHIVIHTQQQFNTLTKKTQNPNFTDNKVKLIQSWIGDFVLKGGAEVTRTTVPWLLNKNLNAITHLGPITEYMNLLSEAIDSGSGILGLVYKHKMIHAAYQELALLKSQPLNPQQLERLQQLETSLKSQQTFLPAQVLEQFFRSMRSLFSSITLALSWIEKTPLIVALSSSVNTLIMAFNALVSGVFFYRAHQNLKTEIKWSQDFTVWIHKQATPPSWKEREKKIQSFKEQLARKEIDIETIKTRLQRLHSLEGIDSQTEDALLAHYVDYHLVLDSILKGALTHMVSKKQAIEKDFLAHKRLEAGARFSIATTIFGVAAILTLIGLILNPIALASFILSILAFHAIAMNLGLTAHSYYHAYQIKPASTTALLKGASLRLFFYHALANFYTFKGKADNYLQKVWQEKKDQVAHRVQQVFKFQVKKLEDLSSHQQKLEKNQREVQRLKEKASVIQKELKQLAWKDFAEQADLKIASQPLKPGQFDTLETLNLALSYADSQLLSSETKELLEKQLGFSFSSLQAKIEQDPSAIKDLLQDFFGGNDAEFVQFINQTKRVS